MRGIVERWDTAWGNGWIRPVPEPDRALRISPNAKISVEKRVLSPSIRDGLRVGQQVGFVYRAPERPESSPRAECVVVIKDVVVKDVAIQHVAIQDAPQVVKSGAAK